jgi:DNA-binding response OmpR family regulator
VSTVRIIVISPDAGIGTMLTEALCRSRFDVVDVRPGPDVVATARREQPQIAVIDGIHERAEAAELEIAVLKHMQPEVQIIALSKESSARDARIVELGIFYYMAGPPGKELIRVVEAAFSFLARKSEGACTNGDSKMKRNQPDESG